MQELSIKPSLTSTRSETYMWPWGGQGWERVGECLQKDLNTRNLILSPGKKYKWRKGGLRFLDKPLILRQHSNVLVHTICIEDSRNCYLFPKSCVHCRCRKYMCDSIRLVISLIHSSSPPYVIRNYTIVSFSCRPKCASWRMKTQQ